MRYAERNALRAGLIKRAEDWRWGSLLLRSQPVEERPWLVKPSDPTLPRRWVEIVNRPQTEAEVEALRRCIQRGTPFGTAAWQQSSVIRLGLESTIRPRGRPKPPVKDLTPFLTPDPTNSPSPTSQRTLQVSRTSRAHIRAS
jgi:putative transposase